MTMSEPTNDTLGDKKVLLQVRDLQKHYALPQFFAQPNTVRALDGVSFDIYENETLAVVGESGCGKSTLAKVIMQLESSTAGEMTLAGQPLASISARDLTRSVQMIFQDPYGSLNPRKKILQIIGEPLKINTSLSDQEISEQVRQLMESVGLRPEQAERYPHMFSGGQRQRVGIARALTLNPKMIICDEPVSALDLSIQSQVLNLLTKLQDERGISYLFISHDLAIVNHIAHRVVVMYLGKIVEMGQREDIFREPLHPYTKALLDSTPSFIRGPKQVGAVLKGELPSPVDPPPGCTFHKRCPLAKGICTSVVPEIKNREGRWLGCHLVEGD